MKKQAAEGNKPADLVVWARVEVTALLVVVRAVLDPSVFFLAVFGLGCKKIRDFF